MEENKVEKQSADAAQNGHSAEHNSPHHLGEHHLPDIGKQSRICYMIARVVCGVVSKFLFKPKVIRNELKGKRGPLVVIANHQAAYDFVNMIGLTRQRMTFVISDSFYESLPIKGFLKRLGVIPKQQFQTTLRDMRCIRSVIDHREILTIYPAGLMCEDGLSTPIPPATYQFLKWIKADIYMAKTSGTYFAMPKWADNKRRGRTYMDVYKLFSKEELEGMEIEEIKERTDRALLFDAYREQEDLRVKYRGGENIEGLENVLYTCPNCKSEFTIKAKNGNILYCESCGFEHTSDEYGFLHNSGNVGEEIRYPSDWSRMVDDLLRDEIERGEISELSSRAEIHMINYEKHKFEHAGEGVITLREGHFNIVGEIDGESIDIDVPTDNFASLPFKPGKYIEIQHGTDIYRCILEDGRLAAKFINMVQIFYARHMASCAKGR